LGLLCVLIHLALGNRFGYHHDEMYFAACGKRLALGYVDQPPLVPWLAALCQKLFGESLRGLRLFPALAGGASVFLTGILTSRLGGGRYAQTVACMAILVAPVYLRGQNLLAIPAFEPVIWLACSLLAMTIVRDGRRRLWLWVGFIAGVGLMVKHTMLLYGFGLVVGLLATSQRHWLRSRQLWAGGGIAFLVFLPNLIWQMQNGWPTYLWLKNLNEHIASEISPVEFLIGQLLYLNPVTVPLWIAGLWFLFRKKEAKPYRFLGWIWVTSFILLIGSGGKIYYLAPAYPVLLAGGAVMAERWVGARVRLRRAVPAVIIAAGLVLAPLSLPMLPIETTDRYIKAATFGLLEDAYELTADLHDQFGWKQQVDLVEEAWNSLTEEEKGRAIILVTGRGTASAIDFFGESRGLPPARCGVLSYWLWGYGDGPVDILVTVGFGQESLDTLANDVTEIGVFTHPHVNPWRDNQIVAVCRDLNLTMEELWPQLKQW